MLSFTSVVFVYVTELPNVNMLIESSVLLLGVPVFVFTSDGKIMKILLNNNNNEHSKYW